MNPVGQAVAECRAGMPALAVLMGVLTRHLLDRFPVGIWREGDVVITNDSWLATGHLPDVAMVTPIFRRGALAGFAGTAAHVPDIGGTPSMGVTDLMAEGLLIPPLQLYREGTRNEEAVALIRGNVRLSAQVWGDLDAQLAAQQICHRRVAEFLDDTGEDGLTVLAATLSCCRIDDDRRPGNSSKKSGRGCRIGAVVFVAGVRPPTRGGAKAKEPRS